MSLIQLGIDSALDGSWDGVKGNIVKSGLGLISMALNIVFMIQHYVIYKDAGEGKPEDDEEEGDDEENTRGRGSNPQNERTPLIQSSDRE